MPITEKTRKTIWGLSGNRCAFPGCNKELFMTDGDSSSLVGEECHICARSIGGPRYNPNLSDKELNDYSNLILLCSVHHKFVDDNPNNYTVEVLRDMKSKHESMVRKALDNKSDFDDLQYYSILDYIDMMLGFDSWEEWTSILLSGLPSIKKTQLDSLNDVHSFLMSRVMNGSYPELEFAIANFDAVLPDLYNVFMRHAEQKDGFFITKRFNRISTYDEKQYGLSVKPFDEHIHLIERLTFELTMAGNFLLDTMRKYVDPNYNIATGKLLAAQVCAEYSDEKRYKGLEAIERINSIDTTIKEHIKEDILNNITTDDEKIVVYYIATKKVRLVQKKNITEWLLNNEIHDVNIENAFDLLSAIGSGSVSDDVLTIDLKLFRNITKGDNLLLKEMEETIRRHKRLASELFDHLVERNAIETIIWLFISYIIEERIVSLGDRWRATYQIQSIKEWEEKNLLDSELSDNYGSCLSFFIYNDLVYASEYTEYGNPREYTIYPSLAEHLLHDKDEFYVEIQHAKELHPADIPF